MTRPGVSPETLIGAFSYSLGGKAKATRRAYATDVRLFGKWLAEREKELIRAERADIWEYFASCTDKNERPRTVARRASSLRRFYGFLEDSGLVMHNPTKGIRGPKIIKSTPRLLSHEEVGMILEAPNTALPLGYRDRTILELLYATGMRVSELSALKVEHIDLERGKVRIVSTKEDGSDTLLRSIPLGEYALQWVGDFIAGPRKEILKEYESAYLFTSCRQARLDRQALDHLIKKYVEKVGIKKRISSQTFRNTLAFHMVESGADIQTIGTVLGQRRSTTEMLVRRFYGKRVRETVPGPRRRLGTTGHSSRYPGLSHLGVFLSKD